MIDPYLERDKDKIHTFKRFPYLFGFGTDPAGARLGALNGTQQQHKTYPGGQHIQWPSEHTINHRPRIERYTFPDMESSSDSFLKRLRSLFTWGGKGKHKR